MMSKKKTKINVIRNLADGPRDYPLSNGESIYLAPKGIIRVSEELISNALITAQRKRLIDIYEVSEEDVLEVNDDVITSEEAGE